ncbi:MAG: TenA family protein [Actinomycetota bacterium]|nr:TenA family protein [Actinomycetota bacterium]
MSASTFSADAWNRVQPAFAAIVRHPFVVALGDGSLAPVVFTRYLLDDAHYLTGFARALALTAARLPDPDGLATLASSAAGAIAAERSLHTTFLTDVGIDPDAQGVAEPTPTCRAYLATLVCDAALAPVEVAVSGLLPCFRVYEEVGRRIAATAQHARQAHPYRQWIATYADPAFVASVRAAEELADRLAAPVSAARVEDMHRAYALSTRYEWMFWDASWRGESWPRHGFE